MRRAYTLLGFSFAIVLIGAYISVEKAQAPNTTKGEVTTTSTAQLLATSTHSMDTLKLTSPAFEDNGLLPTSATCDGLGVNPELHISGVPEGTKALALLAYDPDIPQVVKDTNHIERFDHWVLYNIAPDTSVIKEDATVGLSGLNSTGAEGYTPACPPKQYEPKEHRYIFTLYALREPLTFSSTPTLLEVETAARAVSAGEATLTGKYERP